MGVRLARNGYDGRAMSASGSISFDFAVATMFIMSKRNNGVFLRVMSKSCEYGLPVGRNVEVSPESEFGEKFLELFSNC